MDTETSLTIHVGHVVPGVPFPAIHVLRRIIKKCTIVTFVILTKLSLSQNQQKLTSTLSYSQFFLNQILSLESQF